jgi:hydroxymethylbilane synthase
MTEGGNKLIIGSRGSELALWQANWAKAELERRLGSGSVEINIIKTTGDKILDAPLSKIGDKGLFTKELDHALLEGSIHLAVHSMKDVPTALPEGLAIAAITKREDIRDVFVCHPSKHHKHIQDLPQGATIATGSLRRRCQLLNWRNDLKISDLRGNLGTRLEKLRSSDWDGIILARAGMLRLGLSDRITEIIPVEKILPAVGQGALAIVVRSDDHDTFRKVHALHHEPTAYAVKAERAFLRFLEGGCQVPIGTHARMEDNQLLFDGLIGSLDGKRVVRGKTHSAPEQSEDAATELAKTLYKSGGKEVLDEIRELGQAAIAV